jgi:hypothetical protein
MHSRGMAVAGEIDDLDAEVVRLDVTRRFIPPAHLDAQSEHTGHRDRSRDRLVPPGQWQRTDQQSRRKQEGRYQPHDGSGSQPRDEQEAGQECTDDRTDRRGGVNRAHRVSTSLQISQRQLHNERRYHPEHEARHEKDRRDRHDDARQK